MSQGTLRKLGCQSGDAVEYRKANIWNVLWAKKWIAALAILGFIIAVAQAIISLASLTPTPKHTPEGIVIIAAFVIAGITVWQASSD